MLETTADTIGFVAQAPASMIAWEGAMPSLMVPKRPERRSDRVTNSPARSGADLRRFQSSGEKFDERFVLLSLIMS